MKTGKSVHALKISLSDFRLHKYLSQRYLTAVLIAPLLILTTVIYWPGLSGTFVLDDVLSLQILNQIESVTDINSLMLLSSEAVGYFGRPVSMLSFLIDDQYFPGEAGKFRYTNLMIHLLCGLLILSLLLKILRVTELSENQQRYLAILVFAYWLVHPLNVSTTLYIVQRMTQIMSLFVLAGMIFYVHGRSIVSRNEKLGLTIMSASVAFFGLLALLSKENGVLICVYMLALELSLFGNVEKSKWTKIWIYIFVYFSVTILVLYLFFSFKGFLNAYEYRPFTMSERMLTEFRILIDYLYQIVIPPSGKTGLFHDDYVVSKSLFSPFTTVVALILVCSSMFAAIKFRTKYPVAAFAVFWFFGGHLLESTIVPLELYFEHRNYLPMIGPITAVFYYLIQFSSRLQNKAHQYLLHAVPVVLIVAASIFTSQSATVWGDPKLMYSTWHDEHPNSIRAAAMHASVVADERDFVSAINILETAHQRHPDAIGMLIFSLELSCQANIPPRHTVDEVVSAARHGANYNALHLITNKLMQSVLQGKCKYLSLNDLISIVSALEGTKWLRHTSKVAILRMLSDLYVYKRELSPAVETLDRAYKEVPSSDIAIRQARLLASAGLYKDALNYLEKARMLELKKPIWLKSEMKTILQLQKAIQARISSGNSQ